MSIVKNIALDKTNNKEWLFLFERELLPLTVVFSGTEGIVNKMQKEIGWSFKNLLFIFENNMLKSFRGEKDENSFKNFIEKKINADPNFLLGIQNKIKLYSNNFVTALDEIKNSKFNSLNNLKLHRMYKRAYLAEVNLASVFQIPYYLEGFANLNVDQDIIKLAQLRDTASNLFYETYSKNYYGLFDEFAARLKLKPETVKFLSPYEIMESLENNFLSISNILLKKRMISYVFLVINKNINLLVGKEANNFKNNLKIKTEKNDAIDINSQLIKGTTACKGSVKGIVKVVKSISSADKIKKGDVVVSIMTSVTLYPYLKNVCAIITDEGGLTSHAAIVSRELNIPCIVGTKIATQILKDGDLVEVDADNGIIKILRKAH